MIVYALLALGLEPTITVLETCQAEAELAVAEIRHIAQHRARGARLTNATDGGEGMTGWRGTEESRRRQSEALRGKPKSPSHRTRIIAMITGQKA